MLDGLVLIKNFEIETVHAYISFTEMCLFVVMGGYDDTNYTISLYSMLYTYKWKLGVIWDH
jgi:hypothetical protein